jgi:endoglucanase
MNIVQVRRYLLSLLFLIPFALRADDLLGQNTFNDGVGLPWHISESEETNSDFAIANGVYSVTINKATTERWDVQIRHRGIALQSGHTYTVKFKIKATKATKVYAKIGQQGDPYTEFWNNNQTELNLSANTETSINTTFTSSATDATCEFAFHLGGNLTGSTPLTVTFDDIYLSDPQYTKPVEPPAEPLPIVRVNQVGYLPNAHKIATVISTSTSALDWSLKDGSGTVVTSGKTTPRSGVDAASGENVHHLDFSSATKAGTGYTLVVTEGGEANVSHPFDIAGSIYTTMRKDALAYFYHNRSAIKIEMPYCGRADLARAAGHPSDIAPTWPGTGQDNYSLDVTGGWYDAGDHGKYVVNGGITVWTMMMMYERALAVNKTAQFADGTLNIPEKANGFPDILDEARWQLEFMLKMQVPEGHSTTGMVHHKIHDSTWTALGVAPADDKKARFLRPVSTAATLNLAATAAQASRIWKTMDPTFSAKCLTAAEKAWTAALANPAIYAPNFKTGGGPYNDSYVEDEFYWAACELYVTTGKSEYLTKLQASKHYLDLPSTLTSGEDLGLMGCFTWGSVQGLGTITLALVKGNLDEAEVTKAKNACAAAADVWIAQMENEGYTVPIKVGDNGYPWGSNSFVLNDLIVMALARDFTKNDKYLNGVTDGIDYVLGRNPMDKCYVSGYGENPLENPHHRFWAYQSDPKFPKPPAGAVSGGPNSGLQDPWVQGSGWKGTGPDAIPGAKCYMDNIESWSTNEVTINWNVALAWITAYLDENSNFSQSAVMPYTSSSIHTQKFSPVIEARRNCLAISLGKINEAKISIYNASGRVLYSEKVTQKTGKVIIGNNLYGKAAGLVIVNIQSKLGTFQNSLIVK